MKEAYIIDLDRLPKNEKSCQIEENIPEINR